MINKWSYTVEDLRVLYTILQDSLDHLGYSADKDPLKRATSSLKVILDRGDCSDEVIIGHVCFDDCKLIDPGFNQYLYTAPIDEIRLKRESSTYLGKALIDWRLKIRR